MSASSRQQDLHYAKRMSCLIELPFLDLIDRRPDRLMLLDGKAPSLL